MGRRRRRGREIEETEMLRKAAVWTSIKAPLMHFTKNIVSAFIRFHTFVQRASRLSHMLGVVLSVHHVQLKSKCKG